MTKKDYVIIALAMAGSKPLRDLQMIPQWTRDVESLASVLGTDNPRFNKEKFIEACNS